MYSVHCKWSVPNILTVVTGETLIEHSTHIPWTENAAQQPVTEIDVSK